ncbi:MAG: nucleotide sugar dehydrogenase [Bacteroidia bacterium]|nr:nucleotide sugar dehydrogenase [Bacteroidia bacterium]
MRQNLDKICCKPQDNLGFVLRLFNDSKSFNLPSGIALVLDSNKKLIGTVTEGDVRRTLISGKSMDTNVQEFMALDPITFQDGLSISQILDLLPNELLKRKRKASKYLSKIIIVDENNVPIKVFDYHELWEQKVATHRHLVVIGLGYVGLTMAVVMADAGFMVTGVEVDDFRFNSLMSADSYIHEVGLPELLKEQLNRNLFISKEIPEDGDVFIISVGTPVKENEFGVKFPLMNYLEDSAQKISKVLNRGNLVILRSTVPIGTCRDIVKPILEKGSGLKAGIDFHLSFAPERTAEGKALKELRSLPQIIGGINNDSTEATAAIFRDLTPTIVKVESLEAAEMAKLMNNTFRDYIFAYSNKMAQLASEFNINVFNVIQAANEGYVRDPIPLPSPGVGGPCLTKDPHIFATVAFQKNLDGGLFINGREINESMHEFIFNRICNQLRIVGKELQDCNVLICGLAFKGYPETGDIRNSTAIDIADFFRGKVNQIKAFDAVATFNEINEFNLSPVNLPDGFINTDIVLFLNNHKYFEKLNIFDMVRNMNKNPIIFDGWNLFRWEDIVSVKPCSYLGLSFVKSSI